MIVQHCLRALLWGAFAWTAWSWYHLFRNYRAARKIGIPLRVLPISHENPAWMIVDKVFVPLFKKIPFGTGSFTRYNWRGWEFEDKFRSHEELGGAFVLVTPGRNWLYVCDPVALADIFQRRADFPRPLEIYEMTNVFGPNLSTTDGEQWQRQRKVTASAFNELNNEMVWAESLRQGHDMIAYWGRQQRVRTTSDDVRTFSLHVLSYAGFHKSYEFQGHDERKEKGIATDYKESLKLILENCVFLFVFGTRIIAKPWMPAKIRALHKAVLTFKNYMTDLYESEKNAFAPGKSARTNLMSALVREAQADKKGGLTESEFYGNMFLFNFAGHDTTAAALGFSFVLLATDPSTQDWIHEELDDVFGDRDPSQWVYADFQRMPRCLAIMMESLRLYAPVPIAKSTGKRPTALTVDGRTFTLPANTLVIPQHFAVHTHPKIWGQDSLEWKPSRWIAENGPQEGETIITPQKGSYVAWSEGLRVCPGRKFSQVEFVACMAAVFRDWYVEPVVYAGETMVQARNRVAKLVEEDTAIVLLLQMLHPERAPLVWKRWNRTSPPR
ncbi:cytochrome P450 [Sporormia fimetaria CBS 119925]|uniref:Cytochrome P450 n=1 Tax=Sporormia fimetaria CBS 119925 TaxID=1340428 RepID=A0A6A6VAP4_9PLEO|nr:cytochrome P450 [Sporormia fimetaria CBS 119925]